MISGVRQEDYYKAIQYLHISAKYPIKKIVPKTEHQQKCILQMAA